MEINKNERILDIFFIFFPTFNLKNVLRRRKVADTKLISQKQIDKVPVKQKKTAKKKNPINMPNTTYKTKDYLTQQKKKNTKNKDGLR